MSRIGEIFMDWLVPLVFCMLVFFLGVLMGAEARKAKFQEAAVEKGHAEWYIKDHHQEWRWKEIGDKP
jgi:hypothetical protein